MNRQCFQCREIRHIHFLRPSSIVAITYLDLGQSRIVIASVKFVEMTEPFIGGYVLERVALDAFFLGVRSVLERNVESVLPPIMVAILHWGVSPYPYPYGPTESGPQSSSARTR